MPPKKLTKKQQELNKLKEEHFDKEDKLQSILIYDKNDCIIKNYQYVPRLTKIYKVYYEDDEGNIITQKAYEKINTKDKQIIACELEENNGLLMESLEYLRVGDDDSKYIINFEETSNLLI